MPTDAELLAAHVAGDPDAFGELVVRHRDRLWAVALRTMGNPDDAADGLQDGLIAAYRRAGSVRGEAQVTTWLHRVVVNACLDRLRAASSRRAGPLPDDLDERRPLGSPTGTGPVDPADAQVAADQRARVLTALAALPTEQRAAIVLVDMEGYSVAEAAEVLDCPTGTVKSRCARGRAKLAVTLADLLDDGPVASASSEPAGNRLDPGTVPSPEMPRGPPAAPA